MSLLFFAFSRYRFFCFHNQSQSSICVVDQRARELRRRAISTAIAYSAASAARRRADLSVRRPRYPTQSATCCFSRTSLALIVLLLLLHCLPVHTDDDGGDGDGERSDAATVGLATHALHTLLHIAGLQHRLDLVRLVLVVAARSLAVARAARLAGRPRRSQQLTQRQHRATTTATAAAGQFRRALSAAHRALRALHERAGHNHGQSESSRQDQQPLHELAGRVARHTRRARLSASVADRRCPRHPCLIRFDSRQATPTTATATAAAASKSPTNNAAAAAAATQAASTATATVEREEQRRLEQVALLRLVVVVEQTSRHREGRCVHTYTNKHNTNNNNNEQRQVAIRDHSQRDGDHADHANHHQINVRIGTQDLDAQEQDVIEETKKNLIIKMSPKMDKRPSQFYFDQMTFL